MNSDTLLVTWQMNTLLHIRVFQLAVIRKELIIVKLMSQM